MAKLTVLEIEPHNIYVFEKENKEQFSLQIELYGTPKLKIGDVINVCDDLLDKSSANFVQPYAFEKSDITEFSALPKHEKMIVETKDGKTLLKRIYG